jgi:hypothetical protein
VIRRVLVLVTTAAIMHGNRSKVAHILGRHSREVGVRGWRMGTTISSTKRSRLVISSQGSSIKLIGVCTRIAFDNGRSITWGLAAMTSIRSSTTRGMEFMILMLLHLVLLLVGRQRIQEQSSLKLQQVQWQQQQPLMGKAAMQHGITTTSPKGMSSRRCLVLTKMPFRTLACLLSILQPACSSQRAGALQTTTSSSSSSSLAAAGTLQSLGEQ